MTQQINRTYDALGMLTSVSNESGTASYQYNAQMLLTNESKNGINKSYTYTQYGGKSSADAGGYGVTNYTYDSFNLLKRAFDGSFLAFIKSAKKRMTKTLRFKPFFLVQVVGIEPTRYHYHRILSPARLPVPPHLHIFGGHN